MDRFGFLNPEIRFVGNPIFGARASFAHLREDLLVYGTGRHERLELWTTGGELRTIVQWTARERTISAQMIESWRSRRRRELESGGEMTPMRAQVIEAHVGEHLPVAESFPGHARIVVSQSGRIWVQEYRRPDDDGPDRWFVFEADGTFRCAAAVPEDLLVLSVREDRLLALLRDELDVEYVVGLGVGPPESARPD